MIHVPQLLWWRRLESDLRVRECEAQVTLGEAERLAERLRQHRRANHFGESIHEALRVSTPLEERHS